MQAGFRIGYGQTLGQRQRHSRMQMGNRLPRRVVWLHGFKVWLFMLLTFVPLSRLAEHVPGWLATVGFIAYFVLVLAPVAFGVGPIGRRLGKALNEAAVERARAERASLGPRGATPTAETRTIAGRN